MVFDSFGVGEGGNYWKCLKGLFGLKLVLMHVLMKIEKTLWLPSDSFGLYLELTHGLKRIENVSIWIGSEGMPIRKFHQSRLS